MLAYGSEGGCGVTRRMLGIADNRFQEMVKGSGAGNRCGSGLFSLIAWKVLEVGVIQEEKTLGIAPLKF